MSAKVLQGRFWEVCLSKNCERRPRPLPAHRLTAPAIPSPRRCSVLSPPCFDISCRTCVTKDFQRFPDPEPCENLTPGHSRSRNISPATRWLHEEAREEHYIDEDTNQFDKFTDRVPWRAQLIDGCCTATHIEISSTVDFADKQKSLAEEQQRGGADERGAVSPQSMSGEERPHVSQQRQVLNVDEANSAVIDIDPTQQQPQTPQQQQMQQQTQQQQPHQQAQASQRPAVQTDRAMQMDMGPSPRCTESEKSLKIGHDDSSRQRALQRPVDDDAADYWHSSGRLRPSRSTSRGSAPTVST